MTWQRINLCSDIIAYLSNASASQLLELGFTYLSPREFELIQLHRDIGDERLYPLWTPRLTDVLLR